MTDLILSRPSTATLGRPLEHPVRGRINAWFFAAMDRYMRHKYGALKKQLFADLPDTVVEIGAGTGANFPYFRPGTRVVAFEPNRYMHSKLDASARACGLELETHGFGAEAIDLPDESVDAVVASLVLCTVDDPMLAIQQVRRILRPGGRFICIEHVAASPSSFIGRLQRWVYRPWKWFFEGCHTHRPTWKTIEDAGFSHTTIEHFTWDSVFLPVRPQIVATAIK